MGLLFSWIFSVRWLSKHVWTSRSPAVTLLIGWLSTWATGKLFRLVSYVFQVD